MAHGKCSKKISKNLPKASTKKSGSKVVAKKSKAPSAKASQPAKSKGKASEKSDAAGGSRATRPAAGGAKSGPAFSNPAVAAAYQRAVKAYSGAFRKLPD